MAFLLGIAIILLGLGWFSLRRAATTRELSSLPEGRLVYIDDHSNNWRPNDKPFFASTYQLVGKPDYLVETADGVIPVEVKSSSAPNVPYLGHLLQLAAYCLLVEETTGHSPPHGLLKYADALYEVDYTPELRTELLNTLTEIRQDRLAENVSRSHNQPRKCSGCGVNYACDEALSR